MLSTHAQTVLVSFCAQLAGEDASGSDRENTQGPILDAARGGPAEAEWVAVGLDVVSETDADSRCSPGRK
jgi:hypothetical protein